MALPKGFKEFLVKGFILASLFVLIQLITMGLVAKTTLPGNLKLFAMDDLAEAAIFMLAIFIGLNRDKILKIKSYSVGIKTRISSAALVILGLSVYFAYKIFLITNIGLTASHIYSLTIIEYLLLFITLFFLISLVFGFKFCKDFFKEFKAGIFYVLTGTIVVYSLTREFQKLWVYLSGFVGNSIHYLLGLIGTSYLYYVRDLPIISFNGFTIGVAQTCSGIDSVLLFTGLYLGILAWDWKLINKKKAIAVYFPALFGVFVLDIIRIFLLILIGAYVSESFALHTFHTNAASFLFIIYFALFWKFSYNWMKIKNK